MSLERSEGVLGGALSQGKAEHPRALLLDTLVRLFEAELAEIERAHTESTRALKIHMAARAVAASFREDLRASEAALKELRGKILTAQREDDEQAIRSLQEQWAKLSSNCERLRSKLATAEEYAATVSTDQKRELDKLGYVVRSAHNRAEKLRSAVEDALEIEHSRSSKGHKGDQETGTKQANDDFGEMVKFGGSVIVFSIMLLILIIGITALGSALAGQGLP